MLEHLPRHLVRAEGVAVATASIVLFFHEGYPWWVLLVLALAPDLSAIGYVFGPRVGAASYDAVHTYVGPVVLGLAGVVWESDAATMIALVWLAHIGVDRAVGYGLKYPTSFKDTHLQRI